MRPVKPADPAPENGTPRHGGVEHAGDSNVHSEACAAVHFLGDVETTDAPAEDPEHGWVFRILKGHVLGNGKPRGGCRELPVG